MTVEQFDPKAPKQTTTLETATKVIEQQSKELNSDSTKFTKIGFISLGCQRVA